MSLEIINPRIYTKNDYNLISCNYKIINPIKKQIIMKPIHTFYTNLKIYLDKPSYDIFCSNMISAPVQPFNISLANFQNNIISKLLPNRISNKSGTVPFEDVDPGLFSLMNIDYSKSVEDEQIVIIVPKLSGYESVTKENRNRLFLADLESLVDLEFTHPEFQSKVKSKLSKIHLITSNFFEDCDLTTYFGKVTIQQSYITAIQKFIEDILGRTVSSEKMVISKIIKCNPEAEIVSISNYGYKTIITTRSNARIHFSSNQDEEGQLIIIAQHLDNIEGIDINLPLITTSKNKILINNLLDYVRVTSNLPEDENIIKNFLKKEIDIVVNYIINKSPLLKEDDIDNNELKIINYLLKTYYNIFTKYLDKIKNKEKDDSNRFKGLMDKAPMSAYKPPGMGRHLSYL